jgi:hypothetical protein
MFLRYAIGEPEAIRPVDNGEIVASAVTGMMMNAAAVEDVQGRQTGDWRDILWIAKAPLFYQ